MYSDHEVECMYLGRPFEVEVLRREDRPPEPTSVRDGDAGISSRRVYPQLALLVSAVCGAGK